MSIPFSAERPLTARSPAFVVRAARLAALGCLLAGTAFAQLEAPPSPPGNPLTPEKARLGKVLFWDEQIASTRTVACGTCHFPETGGDDPRSATSPLALHPGADGTFGTSDDVLGSPGVPRNPGNGSYTLDSTFGFAPQVTRRRTSSSINAGYSDTLFWDGRAGDEFRDPLTDEVVLASGAALESQAVGPPADSIEMGHDGRDWNDVIARIGASRPLAVASHVPTQLLQWIDGRTYAQLFQEAFGTPEITAARVAMAIASYERTQFTNQAPLDAFILGDNMALSPLEQQGRNVFNASSCDRCHQGPLLTDNDFHFTGLRAQAEDLGRAEVTGLMEDRGRMRTPSLRNTELQAPFMSDGSFATLEEVVDFYDRGGDVDAPNKDPFVRELNLTAQEREALLAFLRRPLTDPRVAAAQPPFDRPRLYTESGRVPSIEMPAGVEPRIVAHEPPLLGNPSFTIAVFDAPEATEALLVVDAQDPGPTRPASGSFAFETVALETDGQGGRVGSVSLAIPNDANLVGQEFFARWYVTPSGGGADAVSNLARFRIFEPIEDAVLFLDDFETGGLGAWSTSVP
ncbi:MAG: cytochrome c peroxidase [Acidobacteriota bacterium]